MIIKDKEINYFQVKTIKYDSIKNKIKIIDLLSLLEIDTFYSSAKRCIQKKGLKLNDKVIIDINYMISELDIIDNKINIQVGKNFLYIINVL